MTLALTAPIRSPLFRAYLLGRFRVERLTSVSEQGAATVADYTPLTDGMWGDRVGNTIGLFKLLLCCENRHALRGWIAEQLWPDFPESNARHSLAQVIRMLRKTLKPGPGEPDVLRDVPGSEGLSLPSQSVLWTDVDAFEEAVTMARQAEHDKHNAAALASWKQAYTLGRAGSFLPDDLYHEWADARRRSHDYLWLQCVHRLAKCYLDEERESEAEDVLIPFWSSHPTDEEALRLLMDALSLQGRYSQALRCYEHSITAIKKELDSDPEPATTDLANYIRRTRQTRKYERRFLHEATEESQRQRRPFNTTIEPIPTPQPTPLEAALGLLASNPFLSLSSMLSAAHERANTSSTVHEALEQLGSSNISTSLEMWLIQIAQYLARAQWTPEMLAEALGVIMPIVEVMSMITRRQFFQVGTAALGSVPLFTEKHIKEDDSLDVSNTLSESIQTAWKLFHTGSNRQVFAIGQAQLSVLQQLHPILPPIARPYLYTGVYSLVGLALHFQDHHQEALRALHSSYIAALSTGEPWYVAQSLICQAGCYHLLDQYSTAIHLIQEALRTVGNPTDAALICAKSHLLTCWADNAMMMQDYHTAQQKLEEAAEYLDHIVPNEEFDKAGWLLLDGKYGLVTGNYRAAASDFEQSLAELPERWKLRRATAALGAAKAYAGMKERDRSLSAAENLIPILDAIHAPMLNHWFVDYLQQDLLHTFPTDEPVNKFITRTYKQLPRLADGS